MPKTPRLREWRDRAALSQEELRERSGVSRATIADLEAGKRAAQPSTVRKLADSLGVAPEDLYAEAAYPKEARRSSHEPSFNDLLAEERRQWIAEVERFIAEAEEVLHAPDLTQDVAYQIVVDATDLHLRAIEEKKAASRERGYTFKQINDVTRAHDRIMVFSEEAHQVFGNRFGESAEAQKALEGQRLRVMRGGAA